VQESHSVGRTGLFPCSDRRGASGPLRVRCSNHRDGLSRAPPAATRRAHGEIRPILALCSTSASLTRRAAGRDVKIHRTGVSRKGESQPSPRVHARAHSRPEQRRPTGRPRRALDASRSIRTSPSIFGEAARCLAVPPYPVPDVRALLAAVVGRSPSPQRDHELLRDRLTELERSRAAPPVGENRKRLRTERQHSACGTTRAIDVSLLADQGPDGHTTPPSSLSGALSDPAGFSAARVHDISNKRSWP